MKNKSARLILASIALVSLAGMATPAEAAPARPVLMKNVWCC